MSDKNFKVDFLGIGAEKAGTTWLAKCLSEHPEIFLPAEKELFFFNEFDPHYLQAENSKYSWGINWYKKYFKKALPSQIKGEFTPTYLYSPKAPQRIKEHNPDIKLIIILRNPAERAYSQFINDKKLGLIKKKTGFEEALRSNPKIIEKSLYCQYLKNYFDVFDKKNILILFLEEVKNNPRSILIKTYGFLGLRDTNFIPPSFAERSNAASLPKFYFLNRLMIKTEYFLREKHLGLILKMMEALKIRSLAIRLRELNTSGRNISQPGPDERKKYLSYFIADIEKLEILLNKNLEEWKKP